MGELRIPPFGEQFDGYEPAHIHHVARSSDDSIWLIQDNRNGLIWKYDHTSETCSVVVQSHSGAVTGTYMVQPCPGLVLSSGIDGTLRAFNVGEEQESELFMDRRGADVGITCLAPTPQEIDPERRTICCGYTDGTIRASAVCKDGFVLVQALKPHTCPVKEVAYNSDGSLLASLGTDNTLFFFEVKTLEEHAVPLGFVQLPCQVNNFTWHDESGNVLLAMEDGTIVELVRPIPDDIDNSETYATNLDYRCVVPELPEIVEEESDEEEE